MFVFFALSMAIATIDASKLTLSPPATIVEVDTGKLKGDLVRLSWSPDGKQLYIQTIERDRSGAIKAAHHYLAELDGRQPKSVDQEPPWSTTYWGWKSAQSAPRMAALKIDVEQAQKRVSSANVPTGGALAKGGIDAGGAAGGAATGFGADDGISAAFQQQMVNVFTLKLKGEVVGEFVNAAAVPGLTFGWAPAGTGLIAFANPSGHVVVMDGRGRKKEIAESKSALLPAWSDDGKRLAYFERTGKNKATLKIVEVAASE